MKHFNKISKVLLNSKVLTLAFILFAVNFAAAQHTINTPTLSPSPTCFSLSSSTAVTVFFTSTGTFNTGNIYTAQLSNSAGLFTSPTSIGTLSSTANSGAIHATIPSGTPAGTGYEIRVMASNPATQSLGTSAFSIGVLPAANAGSPSSLCNGGSVVLGTTAVTGDSYSWASNPSGYSSTVSNPTISPTTTSTYTLTETITATGCTKSNSVVVTVKPVPNANVASTSTICTGGSASLGATAVAGSSYSWDIEPIRFYFGGFKP